jgi:hypothetical protein
MSFMRPIRSIATALLVASVALVGCGSRDNDQAGPDTGPPASAPVTVAPTTPAPPRPPNTPPSAAAAVATATSFMRREVGMAHPVAGPFRWTGARTGQVDIRARIPGDVNPERGPVTVVSLQRLRTVWYVLGTGTEGIRVLSPRAQDPIRSPLTVMVSGGGGVEDRVRVRVTQDRFGRDLELGGAYLSRWTEESPDLTGQVAFGRPSGRTGSVVFTMASGRNGEVTSATVVRVRFTAGQQPPQILSVRSDPPLAEEDGWLQLPSGTVTFEMSATHADRARLVFTPTGTGAAWSARVVAEDRTAADGLRLAWNPEGGVLGRLTVEALGPGGTARREIGSVHRE